MELLVLNPNTSQAMTDDVRKTVERIQRPEIHVTVTNPDFGPESLESFYDYALATFGLIRFFEQSDRKYDGVLVACFGDPGLYAIKEICRFPVIGIAEASMAAATLIGSKFAILGASEKAIPMMENMIMQYGMGARSAGVYAIGISVLDAESNPKKTIEALIAAGGRAVENGAEVLLLGCAGMTGMAKAVEEALGVAVLDPIEAGYSMLETLCVNKIPMSHKGLYAEPMRKTIKKRELLEMRGDAK